MLTALLATTIAVDAWDLVRVEDPSHPDAVAVSATGAVLLAPPAPGTPWTYEAVPEVDGLDAERTLRAVNADLWHERGITGAGVRVAVFDVQWGGVGALSDEIGPVQTHDCWFHPSCLVPMDTRQADFDFEEGSHGVACAEIIHDLAPDAELHLVRVNGRTAYENAIDWAIRERIDVISMSLSFFTDSFYDGTGPISAPILDLDVAGVLMVTSAGNTALAHWRGPLRDADLDGRVDFDGANGLWIFLRAGSRPVVMSWDQYGMCGGTDLDATLFTADRRPLAFGRAEQSVAADRCQPFERLRAQIDVNGWYWFEATVQAGFTSSVSIDVLASGSTIDGNVARGSITDPATSPYALAVGAVAVDGYLTNAAERYSSVGPTNAGVSKPDLAGPTGLTTAAYGAGGFGGTSSATPAVAGMLALVMSEDPERTPRQAADLLMGWAWADGPVVGAPDPALGVGRARLAEPPSASPCGRRPLLMPVLLLPLAGLRGRRRRRVR